MGEAVHPVTQILDPLTQGLIDAFIEELSGLGLKPQDPLKIFIQSIAALNPLLHRTRSTGSGLEPVTLPPTPMGATASTNNTGTHMPPLTTLNAPTLYFLPYPSQKTLSARPWAVLSTCAPTMTAWRSLGIF